jgi:hypothetical protein
MHFPNMQNNNCCLGTIKITTVSYLETNEIKEPMPAELGKIVV